MSCEAHISWMLDEGIFGNHILGNSDLDVPVVLDDKYFEIGLTRQKMVKNLMCVSKTITQSMKSNLKKLLPGGTSHTQVRILIHLDTRFDGLYFSRNPMRLEFSSNFFGVIKDGVASQVYPHMADRDLFIRPNARVSRVPHNDFFLTVGSVLGRHIARHFKIGVSADTHLHCLPMHAPKSSMFEGIPNKITGVYDIDLYLDTRGYEIVSIPFAEVKWFNGNYDIMSLRVKHESYIIAFDKAGDDGSRYLDQGHTIQYHDSMRYYAMKKCVFDQLETFFPDCILQPSDAFNGSYSMTSLIKS